MNEMSVIKKIFIFSLIILLMGNVSGYLEKSLFLVGTVSIWKNKTVTAGSIDENFATMPKTYSPDTASESSSSTNSIQSRTISQESYKENDCQDDFCYQEMADIQNNCGAVADGSYSYEIIGARGFIYINYSKPAKANNNSLWQVKWGYNSSSKKPYYLRYPLPENCWTQDKLQFKIYIGDPSNYEIGGYCLNGSKWQKIFYEAYGNTDKNTVEASPTLAFDGDYSTGIIQGYYEGEQKWLRTLSSENKNVIYEEGMRWCYSEGYEEKKEKKSEKQIELTNNIDEEKDKEKIIIYGVIIFLTSFIIFIIISVLNKRIK